jgi:hypothetical protein
MPRIEIDDENSALLQQFVGRTIKSISRTPDSGLEWAHGENSVTIIFADGSALEFTGYGYDASGLSTTVDDIAGAKLSEPQIPAEGSFPRAKG